MFWIVLVIAVLFYLNSLLRGKPDISPQNKAIAITGAGSGIGEAITDLLVSKGSFVFALDFNIDRLADKYKDNKSVRVIKCDVTSDIELQKTLAAITQEGKGLFGLIACAGIIRAPTTKGLWGSTELDIDKDFKPVMEVNLWGVLRSINTFLPLLQESKGAIIILSSVASRLGMPCNTPYAVSKFAVSSLAQHLRRELATVGVRVFSVEPMYVQTPMVDKYLASYEQPDSTKKTQYPQLQKLLDNSKKGMTHAIKPEQVAKEIHDCLFTSNRRQWRTMVATIPFSVTTNILTTVPYAIYDKLFDMMLRK